MPRKRPPANPNPGTMLALFALSFFAFGLLGLMAVALESPLVFAIVLVVGLFFFIGGFHYFVWGRWLMKSKPPEEDDRERDGESS